MLFFAHIFYVPKTYFLHMFCAKKLCSLHKICKKKCFCTHSQAREYSQVGEYFLAWEYGQGIFTGQYSLNIGQGIFSRQYSLANMVKEYWPENIPRPYSQANTKEFGNSLGLEWEYGQFPWPYSGKLEYGQENWTYLREIGHWEYGQFPWPYYQWRILEKNDGGGGVSGTQER